MDGDKDTRPKLILEAADSGQYGAPPSMMLEMALACGENHLPRGGGVEGQEAGLISKLTSLLNVHNAFHSMVNTSLDMKTWSERYPSYMNIVARVEKMRVDKETNGDN